MTTIYTKPQLDQIAVKIGGEIKKNKTAIEAIKPASTTVAGIVQLNNTVSSTSITQAATANAVKLANDKAAAAIPSTQKGAINGVASLGADGKVMPTQLPALGTAATKNVGTAAGQVMGVSAFGLGGYTNDYAIAISSSVDVKNNLVAKGSHFFRNNGNSPATLQYSSGFFCTSADTYFGMTGDYAGGGIRAFSGANNDAFVTVMDLWHDKNATKDPNGFLKSLDSTGGISVDFIQAGIGAPKIAYKKLTGVIGAVSSTVDIAHGLSQNKILSVDILVTGSNGVRIAPHHPAPTYQYSYQVSNTHVALTTGGSATVVASMPLTVLIIYEV